ncbi:hypothetical protein MRB53_041943 [Persea americana]|nr:hypothetical protein MRB53_041943 [Persea americana]
MFWNLLPPVSSPPSSRKSSHTCIHDPRVTIGAAKSAWARNLCSHIWAFGAQPWRGYTRVTWTKSSELLVLIASGNSIVSFTASYDLHHSPYIALHGQSDYLTPSPPVAGRIIDTLQFVVRLF